MKDLWDHALVVHRPFDGHSFLGVGHVFVGHTDVKPSSIGAMQSCGIVDVAAVQNAQIVGLFRRTSVDPRVPIPVFFTKPTQGHPVPQIFVPTQHQSKHGFRAFQFDHSITSRGEIREFFVVDVTGGVAKTFTNDF